MTTSAPRKDEDWAGIRTKVRSYVRRRVDPACIEDIVGDVMLRLVRHTDKLDAADNRDAWIASVTSSVVVDFYRSQGARRRLLQEAAHDALCGETIEQQGSDEPAALLSDCVPPMLDKLPSRYAETLRVTDIEGQSVGEAAKSLGLSLTGLKSRLQRGRARLKQALLRCCSVETNSRGEVLDFRHKSGNCCGETAPSGNPATGKKCCSGR